MQTGTGLGLAIVNSIVRSPSVAGKVEVVSEEGVGTEIKVVFETEILNEPYNLQEPFVFEDPQRPPVISLLGFKKRSRGAQLLHGVLCRYLRTWWGFALSQDGDELGDIVVLNEDPSPVVTALEQMATHRSFIILSSSRGSPRVMGICNAYENSGGFCHIIHKPGGPFRLRAALKQLLRARQRRQQRMASFTSGVTSDDSISVHSLFMDDLAEPAKRRRGSMDTWSNYPRSPPISSMSGLELAAPVFAEPDRDVIFQHSDTESNLPQDMYGSAVSGRRALIRKGSSDEIQRPKRVLVVEDNSILRNLL